MHPDVEPYAKDAAEKQQAWREAWDRLAESNSRFLSANPDSPSYYAISENHTRNFKEWIAADRALHDAIRIMNERALKAAGIPEDHPLWALARKRKVDL